MDLHRIARIQPRRKPEPVPFHSVPAPAEATRVRLAFRGIELVSAFSQENISQSNCIVLQLHRNMLPLY